MFVFIKIYSKFVSNKKNNKTFMDTNPESKGVSEEAKELAKGVKSRFSDFVSSIGLADVANKSGFHYSALRNSVVGKYNPSLETIFQIKLAYGDSFDEVYVFTGKDIKTKINNPVSKNTENEQLEQKIAALEEKILEREQQIQDLKQDKFFLQNLINKQ